MSNKIDVVIIGSGIGGLVTAAILSKQGLDVLICEKNSYIGGYASSIKLDNFIFDIGAQDHTFLGQRGVEIIKELGMEKDFLSMTPQKKAIFPDYEFYWSTEEETKNYFTQEFPGERDGINTLFQEMEQIYHEIDRYSEFKNLSYTLEKYPALLKYSSYNTSQFLNEFLQAEKLKALFSTFCTFYQGSPPSQLSALHFAGLLTSYFKVGAFYYRGGCQAFTNKLRLIIEKNGGIIKNNTEITQIVLNGDRTVGVISADGEKIKGKYIVSNIDALNTFSKLIGYERLSPVFVSRLKRMKIALSRCQLYLGVNMDISKDTPFVVFLKEGYDTDKEVEMSINNQPVSMRCFIPTVVDQNLAPEGCHCISIAVVASYDEWIKYYNKGKRAYLNHSEELSDRLINMLKRVFPSLSDDKIVVKKLITPVDLQQSTFNSSGALYGWELAPSQSGTKRISFNTPVEGLSLVGQWTIPGGSACLAFRSADIVSASILEDIGKC